MSQTGPFSSREAEAVGIIGTSPAIRQALDLARAFSGLSSAVLITGESGTGKELFSRFIHECSSRRSAPFVAYNCGSASPDLVDADLFGHTQGAFTGATQARKGLIREATGGVLFLDEITDLDLELQPRLLRFLDSGEVRAIGSDTVASCDIRVVAATNADVENLVREGRLRTDLYYRLAALRLTIPPLRDRLDDLDALCGHFTAQVRRTVRSDFPGVDQRTISRMKEHSWPGNVRELKNEIQSAAVAFALRANARPLDVEEPADPSQKGGGHGSTAPTPTSNHVRNQRPRRPKPRDWDVRVALTRHRGNVSAAARELGTTRQSLYRICRDLDIDPTLMREAASAPQASQRPKERFPLFLTRMVGREGEARKIEDSLEQNRLVTLVGAGGVGKSRVALETGRRIQEQFREVGCVDLVSVRNPSLVEVAFAASVSSWETTSGWGGVAAQIGATEALLIVDNCEHLLDECRSTFTELLTACPNLRILATSREPIGIEGEFLLRIQPLETALVIGPSNPPRPASEAAELLRDRAIRAGTPLGHDDHTTALVETLCTHLEGLPLSLELAAGQLRYVALEEIVRQTVEVADSPSRSGQGPIDQTWVQPASGSCDEGDSRHDSLFAAMNWSYQLLDEQERKVFQRVSVFSGGWTADAAMAVVSDETLAPSLVRRVLHHLVDRCLVELAPARDQMGPARFRLSFPALLFSRQELERSGGGDRWIARRNAFYFSLPEFVELEYIDVPIKRSRLVDEADNLLAGILSGEQPISLQQGVSLALHWMCARQRLRAKKLLLHLVATRSEDEAPDWYARAYARLQDADPWSPDFRHWSAQILRIGRRHGLFEAIGADLNRIARYYHNARDFRQERRRYTWARKYLERSGSPHYLGNTFVGLSNIESHVGNPTRARDLLVLAREAFEASGRIKGVASVLNHESAIALELGDMERARSKAVEMYELAKGLNCWTQLDALGAIAFVHVELGEFEEAFEVGGKLLRLSKDGEMRQEEWGHYFRGRSGRELGREQEAESDLLSAIGAIEAAPFVDPHKLGYCLHQLAQLAYDRSDLSEARETLQRCLETLGEPQRSNELIDMHILSGHIAIDLGNLIDAEGWLARCSAEPSDLRPTKWDGVLDLAGHFALATGRFADAAHLFAGSATLRETLGIRLGPIRSGRLAGYEDSLRSHLGSAFDVEWQTGRSWTRNRAMNHVSKLIGLRPTSRGATSSPSEHADGL